MDGHPDVGRAHGKETVLAAHAMEMELGAQECAELFDEANAYIAGLRCLFD